MYILLSHILMTIPFSLEWYESGEGLGHSYLLCMRLGYTHCLLLLLLSIFLRDLHEFYWQDPGSTEGRRKNKADQNHKVPIWSTLSVHRCLATNGSSI